MNKNRLENAQKIRFKVWRRSSCYIRAFNALKRERDKARGLYKNLEEGD